MKNVFTIPISESFLENFTQGFLQRFKSYSPDYSKIKIFFPNKILCNFFAKELAKQATNIILPQIIYFADHQENYNDDFFLSEEFQNIPPAFSNEELKYLILANFESQNSYQASNILKELNQIIDSDKELNDDSKITQYYLNLTKKHHKISFLERRNHIIKARSNFLKNTKPKYPVIIAGTTATRDSVKELTKIIHQLENGYTVIPGFDQLNIDNNLDENHPAYAVINLYDYLGTDKKTIWYNLNNKTNQHLPIIQKLFNKTESNITTKTQNIKLHIVDNIYDEAKLISLILRENIESKTKSLIISNNHNLNNLIAIELEKWNIFLNKKNNPIEHINFFLIIAELLENKNSLLVLIKFLKNNFFQKYHNLLTKIEYQFYNKKITNLKNFLAGIQNHDAKDLEKFISNLLVILEEKYHNFLETNLKIYQYSLDFLEFSPDPSLINNIKNILKFRNQNIHSYEAINFFLKVNNKTIYSHEYITILTNMDSRLLRFEQVIIADSNDGSMPYYENNIHSNNLGQSLSDIAYQLLSPHIHITRHKQANNSPTKPAKWLNRLSYILASEGNDLISNKYNQILKKLEEVTENPSDPITYASPPRNAREHNLSVTQIEKLLRNPYGIYAYKILKLTPLNRTLNEISLAEFGNFIHKSLERYSLNYENINTEKRLETLIKYGEEEFKKIPLHNILYNLWFPRFENIAKWFVNYETGIRQKNVQILIEHNLSITQNNIIISARIDRMELLENQLTIIDYKTGTPPSKKDIENGIASQLILEAIIAADNLQLDISQIDSLEYLQLTGKTDNPVNIIKLANIQTLIKEASSGLANILTTYQDENTPLIAIPNENLKPKYDDYWHLARNSKL